MAEKRLNHHHHHQLENSIKPFHFIWITIEYNYEIKPITNYWHIAAESVKYCKLRINVC